MVVRPSSTWKREGEERRGEGREGTNWTIDREMASISEEESNENEKTEKIRRKNYKTYPEVWLTS